jgi:hypothetical protein
LHSMHPSDQGQSSLALWSHLRLSCFQLWLLGTPGIDYGILLLLHNASLALLDDIISHYCGCQMTRRYYCHCTVHVIDGISLCKLFFVSLTNDRDCMAIFDVMSISVNFVMSFINF